MAELREVFEMTTKQMEPDQDSWNQQERRQRRTARNRKIGVLAVAAAIGLAAIALVLMMRLGETATTPADQPSTVAPAEPTAVEVATGFIAAYDAYDAEQAMTYLAEDANLDGFTPSGGVEDLPLDISFSQAIGFHLTSTSCEAGTVGVDTTVVCAYDFHAIGSDEIGRGPFSGSTYTFTVRDGQIVRASENLDTGKFSPQMWEPFAKWVATNYPKDAAVMYNDTLTDYRLTEESIQLWAQHTREYVKDMGGA